MHWICIFIFSTENRQQSRNSDDTHHFSLTINKIPTFPDQINSRTFQVGGNPVITYAHCPTLFLLLA